MFAANGIVVGVDATPETSVLSTVLLALPALVSLNVSGNNVGDAGVSSLARFLMREHAPPLESLNLAGG